MVEPKVVFSPAYDFRLLGLEAVHPFDGRKFSRAWNAVAQSCPHLPGLTIAPDQRASVTDLLLVHTARYLRRTRTGDFILEVLEVPLPTPAAVLAGPVLRRTIVSSMLWAVAGTMLAARRAVATGLCMNLGGGFHHAGPESGEGFCLYADVPIAISSARHAGILPEDACVLIVDLDAHQGNGFERAFLADERVRFLDAFNGDIYPRDEIAERRIDYKVKLRSGTTDTVYLKRIEEALAHAIDETEADLAFYIAGTDVYEGDRLGQLKISLEGVLRRDALTLDALAAAGIPTVVVTGGGYSRRSSELVAATLARLVDDPNGHD